jgi:hypothetical protein
VPSRFLFSLLLDQGEPTGLLVGVPWRTQPRAFGVFCAFHEKVIRLSY